MIRNSSYHKCECTSMNIFSVDDFEPNANASLSKHRRRFEMYSFPLGRFDIHASVAAKDKEKQTLKAKMWHRSFATKMDAAAIPKQDQCCSEIHPQLTARETIGISPKGVPAMYDRKSLAEFTALRQRHVGHSQHLKSSMSNDHNHEIRTPPPGQH